MNTNTKTVSSQNTWIFMIMLKQSQFDCHIVKLLELLSRNNGSSIVVDSLELAY